VNAREELILFLRRYGGTVGWAIHLPHLIDAVEQEARGKADPKAVRAELREEFLRWLTVDSETTDRRRREYNQAIFDADKGFACFNGTDLGMVMDKFDKAVKNLGRRK
jgi:hypothetical protein